MNKINITSIKAQIQKFFTRTGVKKKRGADGVWAILLVIAIFVIIAISALHLYLFIQVKNDKIFQTTEAGENNQTEIDTEALQDIISQFDQKEKLFNRLLNERLDIVDPAI